MTAFDINTAFAHPLSADEIHSTSAANDTAPDTRDSIVMPVPAHAPEPRFWHPTYGNPSAKWPYSDASGGLIGYVCRFDPPFGPAAGEEQRKQFSPYTLWDTDGGLRWKWRNWPGLRPLYGLKELADHPDAALVVVEGEKCAEAARRVFPRSVVITSSSGSNAAAKTDWSPIAGRQVLIWADADEPGLGYARDVAGVAARLGCSDIRVVDAMALVRRTRDGGTRDPIEKWDVADALDKDGWGPEALRREAVALSAKYEHDGGSEAESDAGAVTEPGSWIQPDLSLLGNGRRAAPAFPLSVLGSFWADWIERKAQGASGPVDYVGTALLASTGALLANVRWATAGASWSEPPILWATLVGGPSSSKSPSIDAAFSLVRHVEDRMGQDFELERMTYEAAREAAEATKEEWKVRVKAAVKNGDEAPLMPASAIAPQEPVRPRIRVADATIEKLGALAAALPRGLLLVRDELAGWLGAFDRYGGGGGSDRAFAIEMYGGRSYVVDRMRSSEPLQIRHLSVGVLGGVQPDKLPAIIAGPDDGLAARFLSSWPDVPPGFSLSRDLSSDAAAQAAFVRLADLTMGSDAFGHPEPKRLCLTPEAEDVLEEFAREMAVRAHEASGMFAGALGKARGHVLRLATIIEHLWWVGEGGSEPKEITPQAVRAAAGLLDGYFIPMAARVFGDAAIPAAERNAMTLARYLRVHRLTTFNAKTLRREIGGALRESAAMDTACEALREAGLIRARSEKGTGPGRPAKNYTVNPAVLAGLQ